MNYHTKKKEDVAMKPEQKAKQIQRLVCWVICISSA